MPVASLLWPGVELQGRQVEAKEEEAEKVTVEGVRAHVIRTEWAVVVAADVAARAMARQRQSVMLHVRLRKGKHFSFHHQQGSLRSLGQERKSVL